MTTRSHRPSRSSTRRCFILHRAASVRIHLFEWLDQSWLPGSLRDAMRRYLAASYRMTPLPTLWAEPLAHVLLETGGSSIVDLGSGASGPIHLVIEELQRFAVAPTVTLTDLYPVHLTAAEQRETPHVRAWPEPVDARAVPPSLRGVRTMFAAFHHLRTDDASRVLRDAFAQRQTIAVFEATSRTPAAILLSLLIPLLVLVLTPKVRPLTPAHLVFTYLVPILPLLIFWDGLVSHLRTYSVADLRALTSELNAPDYVWTIGSLSARGIPFTVPYLIGRKI